MKRQSLVNICILMVFLTVGVGSVSYAGEIYLMLPKFEENRATSAGKASTFWSAKKTEEGREIEKKILSEAVNNAEAPSPCEFLAYQGRLLGKTVSVYLYENEENARLLGAAVGNSIYVCDGNVIGVPDEGMQDFSPVKEAREKGVPTGIKFIDGVASLAAQRIEEAVETGKEGINLRVRLARRPSDINIEISDVARRYMMSRKKKIQISGPVFVGIRAEISD